MDARKPFPTLLRAIDRHTFCFAHWTGPIRSLWRACQPPPKKNDNYQVKSNGQATTSSATQFGCSSGNPCFAFSHFWVDVLYTSKLLLWLYVQLHASFELHWRWRPSRNRRTLYLSPTVPRFCAYIYLSMSERGLCVIDTTDGIIKHRRVERPFRYPSPLLLLGWNSFGMCVAGLEYIRWCWRGLCCYIYPVYVYIYIPRER